MATIEELTSTIISDARAQAQRIDEETDAEVTRLEEETAKLLAAERERLYAQAKREQTELEQRAEAKRQLEATQKALLFKQELIDDVFKSAERALHDMSAGKRRKLIHALHERVKRQIAIGSIYAAKKDVRYIKGARVGDGSGGFVAKSKDGKVMIDMRFDTLLTDIKARKTANVAKILFYEKEVKRKAVKKTAKKVTKKPKKAKKKQ